MIVNMDYIDILDYTDTLIDHIKHSDVMKSYKDAYNELIADNEAQRLIQAFKQIKNDYEDLQRFGRYHPDYNDIMKNVRRAKRQMDMNEYVVAFKIAERQLQNFLDEISTIVAHSVSEHIIVPVDGAALTDGGCSTGGGCGSGGSCSCQAS